MRVIRGLLAFLAAVVLLPLAACSAPEAVGVDADTVVLDVRTQGEYTAGHLDGAALLDLNSGQLQAALPQLDPDATYVVYCRSGNRSGQAVSLMEDAGFTDVTDLGSMSRASTATGLAVVTG